jgi:hypothetical protein
MTTAAIFALAASRSTSYRAARAYTQARKGSQVFWKLITLAVVPAVAIVCVIVRQLSKRPVSEYDRWRAAGERMGRR